MRLLKQSSRRSKSLTRSTFEHDAQYAFVDAHLVGVAAHIVVRGSLPPLQHRLVRVERRHKETFPGLRLRPRVFLQTIGWLMRRHFTYIFGPPVLASKSLRPSRTTIDWRSSVSTALNPWLRSPQ